ncbi:xylulokinase [Atopobiaceae bacterium SGI.236]|nr:FGGY family carbohydrate kinase [Atopobiaceae bacterium]
MGKKYLLAADCGTTAIKVALFDTEGNKVVHHAEEYALIRPSAQRVEQKPEVYWDTFRTCLSRVLSDSAVDPDDIVAFAFDSSAETMVFMDENMEPLDNFYVWMDNRAEEEAVEINEHFSADEIGRHTGQCPIEPVFPATEVLWFKKNKPEKFERVSMMFMTDDYLLWRMCGKKVSHGSSWCTSYMWDINTRDWWPEMLDYLGVTADQLPEILETGTPIGHLLPEMADELGLSRDMLLVMGAQDQSAGAIGVGNVRPGTFSESTGGALMVCTTLEKSFYDENGNVPCNYSDLGGYMIQGGAKGGIVIKWLRDTLCEAEKDAEARGEGNAYDLMDKLAAETPAGAEGLFVLPFFGGGSNPTPDIYGRGVLYGMSLGHTRGHIVRAFLEATAVNIAMIVNYCEDLTGVKVTQVRSLGGGSLSPFWCQVKADVLNREVVTMRNTQDAACLGAAIIAGYGAGIYDSIADTALKFAEVDKVYTPNPENRAVYDRLIKKYQLLIDATHGYTEELSKEV